MGIKVTAIQRGYYGLLLREPGATFDIQDEQEFSKKWMVKGQQKFSQEELDQLGRDSRRATQSQLLSATKGAPAAKVSVAVPEKVGRASDKSPI